MRFNGKTVIVTGAAQRGNGLSLGVAYADAFLSEGCTELVVMDIREEALTWTVQRLRNKHPGATVVARLIDVTNAQAVAALIAEVHAQFGKIDVLVNNAGTIPNSKDEAATKASMYRRRVGKESLRILDKLTDSDWLKYWDVNVHGTFWCTREALRVMYEQGYGSIINIASIAAFGPAAGFAPGYAASKAAVVGMSKAMAEEAARFGVRINVFAPSAPNDGTWDKLPEEVIGTAKRSVPIGRLGTLEEYAKCVLFLADDGYMVGQVLTSNGGIHI